MFKTGKRFNTAFSIHFELDHDNEDKSDLTPADFRRALLERIIALESEDPDLWPLALDPFDTVENPEWEQLERYRAIVKGGS